MRPTHSLEDISDNHCTLTRSRTSLAFTLLHSAVVMLAMFKYLTLQQQQHSCILYSQLTFICGWPIYQALPTGINRSQWVVVDPVT